MNKKNKKITLISGLSIIGIIAIVTPSVLYVQSSSLIANTNRLKTDLSSIYTRQILSYNPNPQYSNLSPNTEYNSLPIYSQANLYQMLNGDTDINNGNYMIVIGNQTELAYQAIMYSNFISPNVNSLNDYNVSNIQNGLLNTIMGSISWNIPVYSYLQFPTFTQNDILNNSLSLLNVYKTFAPQNTSSPTIQDSLYNHLIAYAKRIWGASNSNNVLVLAFVKGKASIWNQKEISKFLTSSDSSLTSTIKTNIYDSYQSSLTSFIQSKYSFSSSTTSSSSSSSSDSTTSS